MNMYLLREEWAATNGDGNRQPGSPDQKDFTEIAPGKNSYIGILAYRWPSGGRQLADSDLRRSHVISRVERLYCTEQSSTPNTDRRQQGLFTCSIQQSEMLSGCL